MAGTRKDVELKGSEQGHKDAHVRDAGAKQPVVQLGHVDIEREAKTKA